MDKNLKKHVASDMIYGWHNPRRNISTISATMIIKHWPYCLEHWSQIWINREPLQTSFINQSNYQRNFPHEIYNLNGEPYNEMRKLDPYIETVK